jgi:hypothetical protein
VATTQRPKGKRFVPSEKQRAEDEKLRDELRNFDLKTFDKVLDKAIKPLSRSSKTENGNS